MSSRDINKLIARDTLACIYNGYYTLNGEKKCFNTNLIDIQPRTIIPPDIAMQPKMKFSKGKKTCKITVINDTTINSAIKLCRESYSEEDKVLILNFASAKAKGGGFLSGANAQEESIMRATTAFTTLDKSPLFYKINRRSGTPLYTDTMIYSPLIEIFKNDKGDYLDEPLPCSLLTIPAVNARIARKQDITWTIINTTMRNRIFKIVNFIYRRKINKVVLGAFGCGVFKNKPEVVATAFNNAISYYDERYKKDIEFVFAIKTKTNQLINTFKSTLCN